MSNALKRKVNKAKFEIAPILGKVTEIPDNLEDALNFVIKCDLSRDFYLKNNGKHSAADIIGRINHILSQSEKETGTVWKCPVLESSEHGLMISYEKAMYIWMHTHACQYDAIVEGDNDRASELIGMGQICARIIDAICRTSKDEDDLDKLYVAVTPDFTWKLAKLFP